MLPSAPLAPVTVEMFVPSVEETMKWYESSFGFRITHHEQGVFAAVQLENVQLLFAAASYYQGKRARGGNYNPSLAGHGVEIRIVVKDVDAFYERVKRLGIPIIFDIESRYYGLRDFIFEDRNGFHIRVASPIPR
jgi:uncharacterized glyoxalase superfamily protein PhnB